jgi:NAD(P)-dependent dehydrogenase (short-subunit alcohol dehydrogenase family)
MLANQEGGRNGLILEDVSSLLKKKPGLLKVDASIFDLTDRVAIVTGSGQGIGKAIALCFADFGADLVIAERTAETRETTAAEIRTKGRKALAIEVDTRESEQVADMVRRTLAEFGRVDILVNNVGGEFRSTFLDYSERGWDAIVRENLKNNFLCTQAVGGVMVEQKRGCIVNVASVAGIRPSRRGSAYSASKAGIISLTKYLSAEWDGYNVRVNAIAPGYIMTPGVAEWYRQEPEAYDERRKRIPLGRLGQPEDVAKAALFLASDAADYISGITLVVDGAGTTMID